MDGFLADDHVRLSVDAFDISNPFSAYPRLRAQAQFHFLGRFFVGAGVDDILNVAPFLQNGRFLSGTDAFVNAGVSFTDDDVRKILNVAGKQ